MNAVDFMLLTLLTLAAVCLFVQYVRRMNRLVKEERIQRALRAAIRREVGDPEVAECPAATLVLQRAS